MTCKQALCVSTAYTSQTWVETPGQVKQLWIVYAITPGTWVRLTQRRKEQGAVNNVVLLEPKSASLVRSNRCRMCVWSGLLRTGSAGVACKRYTLRTENWIFSTDHEGMYTRLKTFDLCQNYPGQIKQEWRVKVKHHKPRSELPDRWNRCSVQTL